MLPYHFSEEIELRRQYAQAVQGKMITMITVDVNGIHFFAHCITISYLLWVFAFHKIYRHNIKIIH